MLNDFSVKLMAISNMILHGKLRVQCLVIIVVVAGGK